MKLAALAMISAVVISGMLYALIRTLRPFCYNFDGPFFGGRLHQALIRARRMSR
jgi:hypothetical protein